MGLSVQKFVREFDLFSKPFVFFIGDKKSKSTFIGGFLSLSIIAVSIVYFYYLISMYFQNQVEPKITSSIQIENERNSIRINDSFFMMEMLINGVPLREYEKKAGKQYLTYNVYYEEYNSDGSSKYDTLPLTQCTDPEFAGYTCIDQSYFNQDKDIYMEPINQISSDYAIQITPCDATTNENCATEEEINALIFQSTNYFQVFTRIKQYNSNVREYKNGYKSEFYYFDPKMITYTRMSLIAATTSVIEGIIIQTTETNNNIFDYKRIDTYFTKEGSYDRLGIEGFAYIVFELNQVHNIIVIQHAMITEILAQFMSIFNSLLTVGIIARMLAESHIVEDMNNILLKEYYKKTALKLVQRKEIRNSLLKFGNADAVNKVQAVSSFNIIGKIPSMKETCPEKQKSHIIVELQKKIADTNFAEKQRQYFSIGLYERVKIFLSQILGNHQQVDAKKDPNSDPILYRNIIKQSMKRINIFEVYRDIIKLKMAIKLILTKDQFAALQFCGSDIGIEEQQPEPQLESKLQHTQLDKAQIDQQSYGNPPQSVESRYSNGQFSSPQQGNLLMPSIFFKEQRELNGGTPFEHDDKQKNNNQMQSLFKITEMNDETSKKHIQSNQLDQNHKTSPVTSLKLSCDLKNNTSAEVSQDNSEQRIEQQIKLNSKEIIVNQNNQPNKQKVTSLPKRNSIMLGERDHIQSLKINGDQNVLQVSDISFGSDSEDQEEKGQNINKDRSKKLKLLKIKSHLSEMDKIEENEDEQEKFLKEFLVKMKQFINSNGNSDDINHIDQQIYQSLIINEQQVQLIDNLDQEYQKQRQVSIDYPRLNKLVFDAQQNSNNHLQKVTQKAMKIS